MDFGRAALAATVATVAVGGAFDGSRVLLPSTSPSLGRALLAFWLLLTLIQVRGLNTYLLLCVLLLVHTILECDIFYLS